MLTIEVAQIIFIRWGCLCWDSVNALILSDSVIYTKPSDPLSLPFPSLPPRYHHHLLCLRLHSLLLHLFLLTFYPCTFCRNSNNFGKLLYNIESCCNNSVFVELPKFRRCCIKIWSNSNYWNLLQTTSTIVEFAGFFSLGMYVVVCRFFFFPMAWLLCYFQFFSTLMTKAK